MNGRGSKISTRAGAWRAAAISLAVCLGCPALAQETDAEYRLTVEQLPTSQDIEGLRHDSLLAFTNGDIPRAELSLRRQLELEPDSFVVYYNLACCKAQTGKVEEGVELLSKAIEHGFSDIRGLRRDQTLAPLRGHPTFQRIVASWDAVLIARRDANIEAARGLFRSGYDSAVDDRLRLAYLSAFDARSFEAAREELGRIADWVNEEVIPGMLDPAEVENDAWVLVVLPNRADFMRWAASVYGEAAVNSTSLIAGSYEHDKKRLVAMDLGATLRHEFFHALHWRSTTRLGQSHPIWIQEGLCSLIEDYDVDAEGRIQPGPSWRSNIAKRLEKLGRLLPIEKLAALPQQRFSGSRPLANYAQARTVFLYLWQQGKLKDWYAAYTRGYDADPTGVKALEEALGKPIAEINKDYRAWVRALAPVPEEIEAGMASLGIEIDAGTGEGPVVVSVPRRGADRPDLKPGDVITSIGGRATRDIAELVRVLGSFKPGETVKVEYRRARVYGETAVTLVPR